MSKVSVLVAFNKLPHEAQIQVRDVYCADERKEVRDLHILEIISEVKWMFEKLAMDLGECDEEEEKFYRSELKKCKTWYKHYKKYDTKPDIGYFESKYDFPTILRQG